MSADEIEAGVISVLRRMVQDWDLDQPLQPDSRIVADLAFESIDLIQLVVGLEQHFGNRRLGFNELLMTNGRYVDDLSIQQIIDFLKLRLN